FVPPDPLISMVKSALVRAGVAHAGFTPPKPAAGAAPEPPVEAPRTVEPPEPLPSFETESFVDEGPARPAAVKIESDQQPAFGSLLGTEEEDAAVTAMPAIDRDWRTEEVEEEEQEQETDSKASWRRGGDDDDSGVEPPAREAGWRDSVSDQQPVHAHAKHHEPWTPTREKQDMSEAAETEGEASGSPISDFRNIPAAPFSGDAWAAAIEAGGQNHTAVAEAERPAIHDSVATRAAPDLDTLVGHAEPEMESVPTVEEQSFVTETPVPAPTAAVHAAEEPTSAPEEARQGSEPNSLISEPVKSSASSWFSTPPSPWDAEMQKASKLASTWDTPVAPPVAIETHPSEPFPAASTAPDEIEVVSEAAVSAVTPEAFETAREEASHGATEVDMNAVVEKVMARMSPDKLHELTRDLLKPVIEGIVREELNKKS
ncbi:MAG TPA: hypothetical protein VGG58_03030, partial [Candidatus Acidoferrum sp.]